VKRAWLIPAVLATAIAAALLDPGAAGSKDATQQFFEARLLADKATSSQIRKLLQNGGGFVDKNVVFKDVTDDDRDDAVVRVHSGGAAGVVAVYVFSTANKKGGKLKAIFRSEKLMRASTRVLKNEVSYRTARYAPGDELCCPAQLTQSTLEWDPDIRRMRVAERVTFAPPPQAQAPAAP
jgi:hypothetical protein